MQKNCSTKTSKFRSMKIDRMLQHENAVKKREVQVLLVGSPNAGKNTLSKQIRIHYGDGFPAAARRQVIPIILANLTDAVILVLKNLMNLRVEFADTTTKKLAEELMQAQPENGFVLEISNAKNLSHSLKQNEDICEDETPGTFDYMTADILLNHQGVEEEPARSETARSSRVPLSNVDITAEPSADISIPKILEDEQLCLQESLLRVLQRNESVPPSLVKKFEMLADSNMVDELREALVDINKLRSLYLKLFGQTREALPHSHHDGPPPVPETPPPMSFEDELLNCMVDSNGDFLSEDDSTERSSQTSETESKPVSNSATLPKDKLPRNTTDRLTSSITENAVSNRKSDRDVVRSHHLKMPRGEVISSLPSLSTNSADSICHIFGGFSLRVLKVILKLITEQTEFQEAMQRRTFLTPPIGYADFYFIENVDRIIQEDYVPTLQDILVMREPSKAVREMLTTVGSTSLRIVDLGLQTLNLHRHLHYFESVSAVLFLVSLPDCLKKPYDLNRTGELETSVELFETLMCSPHMLKKEFVVFLNKLDLIRENFSTDSPNHEQEETLATFVESMKERFLALKRKQDAKGSHISINVICALDVDEMREVIRESLRVIFEYNRKRHVLL
ncbi:guanine nucleotide-binding protein alpha-15 subunit [Clonorchis sinensis]|uniref:Guanine nucleotide-binding protein alpha-15 subunit n=1 Tax=Clonorchis sinensis TaxID=79923 RepID=H2KU97_CLOSI|nr:guanine nucleotide-binding protein alpha-15 subunit [Clonorchis sinensis]